MTENNDDYSDISIVPERDELASHGKRRSASIPLVEDVVSVRTGGAVRFLLGVLVLGLLGSGGGAYFFYQQGLETLASLESAGNRIFQLESRLNLTDQAAEQSSLGLLERVDFNFTEIDKLWGTRNVNRVAIEKLNNATEGLQGTLSAIDTMLEEHRDALGDNAALIGSVQTRMETVINNFSGMDDLGQQLTTINADLNRVKTAMATVENSLASRVNTTEQDIESINMFRLQLNQTLNTIQGNINSLQQRVGQPLTP